MAEVKWIKIVTDIFDNRKIKQIECLPEGDAIIVIWVKLLCLAGNINDNGYIYFTKEIPYTDQMLSQQFGRPISTIQLALKTFERFGMVEVIEDMLCISNWEKYQNTEGMERIREQNKNRKKRQREREKQLYIEESHVTSRDSHATDIDKEEDIDIDIDKELEEEKNITVSKETVCQTQNVRLAINEWNNLSNIGISSVSKVKCESKRYKNLVARIKQYGIDEVIKAIGLIRESDFLQGKNNRNWMITFDWFVLPSNFPKVLDGNYTNRTQEEAKQDYIDKWRDA